MCCLGQQQTQRQQRTGIAPGLTEGSRFEQGLRHERSVYEICNEVDWTINQKAPSCQPREGASKLNIIRSTVLYFTEPPQSADQPGKYPRPSTLRCRLRCNCRSRCARH